MGVHEWIDVLNGLGLVTVTVIAVVLGHRLSSHEAFRQKVADHGERLARLEGRLEGMGK